MSDNIEIIEGIVELKEPVWEKQEGESTEWYQKFFLYYLPQQGNRSLKQGLLAYAKANNIIDDNVFDRERTMWSIIAERNKWIEREQAYDLDKQKGLLGNDLANLSTFLGEASKIVQEGMVNSANGLRISGALQEQYIKHLKEQGVITEKGIDFDGFDEAKYASIVKSFKTSAETAKLMIDISADVLGLEQLIATMNANNELDHLIE
jgi:hypothetical protein